nr:type IV pilin protein [uncultured Steroidobacter sp.]
MKHSRKTRRFGPVGSLQRGVTLIELMVVMVIIAILASIAYPSYQRYVARTHRNAAAACLSQIAQAMERRYTTNLTYVDPGGNDEDNHACTLENDLQRFYRIEFAAAVTPSAFRVRAVPTDVQSRAEKQQCGTLTLDNTGARNSRNNDVCW